MSGTPSPLSSPSTSPRRSTVPLRPIRPSPSSSNRLSRRSSRPIIKTSLSLGRIAEESHNGDNSFGLFDQDGIPSTATSSTLSTPALERVKFSWSEPETVMYAGTPPRRNKVENRRDGWNGKKGIRVGSELKESCGICFEAAVMPNKARCCGQLFCYQHLSDWLSAQGSDGRCPTCRVPCSLETDTVYLHPPPKLTRPQPTRRRSRSPRNARRSVPVTFTPLGQEESPRSTSPDRDSSSSSSTTSYDVDSSDTSSDNEDPVGDQSDMPFYPSSSPPLSTLSASSSQRQLLLLSQAGEHYQSFIWGDLARVFTLVGAVIVFCALIPVVVYE
ncbi:uncharacterized protein STEHIDRAFT_172023 [Stereum hirsutum FP-91666 SS1]|uniref:uncharacterized protein n=1 Tax=Stereum hirsutum (strain FP-91666) TaxID=721885 RepID=UPI0004449918|nr:uncharacterized protein STEHIDRAFT_172023 [Stereum hirsutum FP-91666 SS1]EIM81767.1 hypothetical protein STEHIDRAFT_172023 [Stereum hirsutum FP-91666 SS1]